MTFGILLYLLIAISFLQGWWLVVGGLVLAYSVRYSTAWLLPLAILLDGYFNRFATVPYLSLFAIAWFVAVEYLRPRLLNDSAT